MASGPRRPGGGRSGSVADNRWTADHTVETFRHCASGELGARVPGDHPRDSGDPFLDPTLVAVADAHSPNAGEAVRIADDTPYRLATAGRTPT
ncbi:hypothetical protein [Streptomyces misionensis]|uniref:hypothetical protein n=1 Tax=Streptomyces misionensis TaxID=67331 RepID=UPI0036F55651